MKNPVLLVIAGLALLGAGCERPGSGEATPTELSARDAWVRAAPPGRAMTAAYLVIANPGPAAAVLTGVSSPRFGLAEIHESVLVDGVSRMRHRPQVEIPAGGMAALAPGGLHIMLMQPVDGMPSEGSVGLTLSFEDGRTLEVEAPVRRPGGS
jgi:copper(I)-binding protein